MKSRDVSVSAAHSQENEISEDEDLDEEEGPSHHASLEVQPQQHEISEDEEDKEQKDTEALEEEQSFQSAGSNISTARHNYSKDQEYNITKHHVNKNDLSVTHSFTKPLFMNEHGIVSYQHDQLIEEADVENQVLLPENTDYEITLNVSVSDGSDAEKQSITTQKEKNQEEESGLGKSKISSMVEKLTNDLSEKSKKANALNDNDSIKVSLIFINNRHFQIKKYFNWIGSFS